MAALVLALAALGWDLSDDWRSTTAVTGQVAVPSPTGIALVDATSGRSREILRAGQGETITSAAWSPDRGQLAYGLFHRAAGDQVSSGEIFVVPAGGGQGQPLVARDQPGSVVDTPRWSPDGQYLYFGYQGLDGRRPVARVERMRLSDGARTALVEDAIFPDVASDGRSLAFIRDSIAGQSLVVGSTDGGPDRELVARDAFTSMMGPRFSPDGTRIAFTAIGPGPGATGAVPDRDPDGLLATIRSMLSVPVAYAHGETWGAWTIRVDGTDLRRASPLQEDEPMLAWSPDGGSLAVHGMGGVWIVALNGSVEPRRLADGSFGAIDW